MKNIAISVAATLGLFFLVANAEACTDFRIKADDGTLLITRSMEFAADLHSNLMSSPREKTFTTTAPNGQPGLSWKSQYGYVFLDALDTGMAVDGMNEMGLAVEALYLPNETQYQTVAAGNEKHALPYLRFVDWVLGNFKTIDEVKQALPSVFVVEQQIPQAKDMVFPLHFNITDSTGKSIVVELVGGKMHLYDNTIGVLTNAPTYNWQLTNLRNYINLTPTTPKPVVDNGITFVATGQGSGMLGLPGDISPPSRFVKISVLLATAFKPADAVGALNLAQHIINEVDIPLGFVREGGDVNKATSESTEWVVFKDLTNRMFYYRTYTDTTLRAVDLSKVNFAANAPQRKMAITSKQYVEDMTSQFKNGG